MLEGVYCSSARGISTAGVYSFVVWRTFLVLQSKRISGALWNSRKLKNHELIATVTRRHVLDHPQRTKDRPVDTSPWVVRCHRQRGAALWVIAVRRINSGRPHGPPPQSLVSSMKLSTTVRFCGETHNYRSSAQTSGWVRR